MPCEEWSWILYQYRSAVRNYCDAAGAFGVAVPIGFCRDWELAEEARTASARFRADLLEHEHRHGCQAVTKPAQEIRNRVPPSVQG
jgi:hypothetical protein